MNRNQILSLLKQNPNVSILIISGGINGIGAFRDPALSGVDELLVVEQGNVEVSCALSILADRHGVRL